MSKLSQPNPSLTEARPFASMSRVNPHAAGVDIGAQEITVCVPGDENTQLVRSFGTYTADLHAIAAWLKEHHIESVAMESTGVYWIPLFETLEAAGFRCHLISARTLRRIPGRKSDVLDCQWIQTPHSYGLLESSFRPEADLVALRTLLRHRAQMLEHRAPHILHMQKALLQMNIQSPPSVERCHRSDRAGHPPRHRGRRARPTQTGCPAQLPLQEDEEEMPKP